MKMYDLIPLPKQGQKSFYSKAKVVISDNEQTLISYNTPICKIDSKGDICRLWSGYSPTSMKHVNAFIEPKHMTKSDWLKLPIQEV